MRLLGATGSHVGNVREANQDRVHFGGPVAALADGMGGHQGGERAAELAIGQFRRATSELSEGDLVDMVLAANRAVHGHASENGLPGMGTTVVALTLHGDGTMTVANVGDSRAYWIRGDYMSQITEDHSFVEDLVRQGRLTPEEAAIHPQRNILTRAVGIGIEVEVDRFPIEDPAVGDRFLLCSDGLFNEVSEDEILDIILAADGPAEAAAALIEATLQTPCRDNVTVAVVEVVEDEDPRLATMEEIDIEDPGVITSEYLDNDHNAITAQVPIVSADMVRPDEPGAGLHPDDIAASGRPEGAAASGRPDDIAANGRPEGAGSPNGNGASPPVTRLAGDADGPEGQQRLAAAVAVALAEEEEHELAILDEDPEANRPTAEMDLKIDDPLEVRPRSRLLLAFGTLLLVSALAAGGYFGARYYATSGYFVDETEDGTVAIFQGRRDGLFGQFEPAVELTTEVPSAALADFPVKDHHSGLAAAKDELTALTEKFERDTEATADVVDAQSGAAGSSDGTATDQSGSGTNQSTERSSTTLGEGVSGTGDGGSTTEGG